jgi:hypothetical protein
MDEKPRIVAYKLIIDANIVKHRGRTERQNIVHAMEANIVLRLCFETYTNRDVRPSHSQKPH